MQASAVGRRAALKVRDLDKHPQKRGGMMIWLLIAAFLLVLAVAALAWQRGGEQPLRPMEERVILKEGQSA